MRIKVLDFGSRSLGEVVSALHRAINNDSRFKSNITVLSDKVINLGAIRLKESKEYCGSHPMACEIGGKNRKANFLEGADWVEFNDLVNDVLDQYEIGANVQSAVCIIRKDTSRRVHYGAFREGNGWEWNKDEADECYEDWMGVIAPNSTFPEGTPGIYQRNINA